MNHWVSLGSYSIPSDLVVYGDSASIAQAYNSDDPWYWHNFTRSTLFNRFRLMP